MPALNSLILRSLLGALVVSAVCPVSAYHHARGGDTVSAVDEKSGGERLQLASLDGYGGETMVEPEFGERITEASLGAGRQTLDRGCQAELSTAVDKAHIFPPGSRFKVLISGAVDSAIAVSTYKHPDANQRDLMIDALLVAREVLKVSKTAGCDPDDMLDVYFFAADDQSDYVQATVDLPLVKKFQGGQISEQAMFDSLKIKHAKVPNKLAEFSNENYQAISSSLKPMRGILYHERLQLAADIARLKSQGANVGSVQSAFLLIEDAVRQNDDLGTKAAYGYALSLMQNIRLKAERINNRKSRIM